LPRDSYKNHTPYFETLKERKIQFNRPADSPDHFLSILPYFLNNLHSKTRFGVIKLQDIKIKKLLKTVLYFLFRSAYMTYIKRLKIRIKIKIAQDGWNVLSC
jgi:hypothetical protein